LNKNQRRIKRLQRIGDSVIDKERHQFHGGMNIRRNFSI